MLLFHSCSVHLVVTALLLSIIFIFVIVTIAIIIIISSNLVAQIL